MNGMTALWSGPDHSNSSGDSSNSHSGGGDSGGGGDQRYREAPVVTAREVFLDSFQTVLDVSLELLESAGFPFASKPALQYR